MKKTNLIAVRLNGFNRQYENIIFYKDGKIVFEIESNSLEFMKVDAGKLSSINRYDKRLEEIFIHEPRAARKLDLTKTDNFTFNTTSDSYIRKDKDLYIYCGENGDAVVTPAGEFIRFQASGETDYQNAYNLTFTNGIGITACYTEKYLLEDPESYTLQPGEKFSECYGAAGAPCVWPYDNIKYKELYEKTGKPWKHEKGVLKKWQQYETRHETILTAARGYSRTEKTGDRQQREQLAAVMTKALNRASIKLSHYDIENLLNVVNITLK